MSIKDTNKLLREIHLEIISIWKITEINGGTKAKF